MERRAIFVIALTAAIASAQSLTFEVASVRPCPLSKKEGGPVPGVSIAGNRFTAMQTFHKLVEFAYDVKEYQVLGAPDLLPRSGKLRAADEAKGDETKRKADAYCIAAKTGGDRSATTDEARQMMQALLSDRFQLKFHRETRDLPVYALVIGAHGPKLKESAPATEYSAHIARVKDPKQLRMTAAAATMPQFAVGISKYTDRPVIDKTGLAVRYDLKLDWFLDSKSSAVDPGGPTVFTAIQQQLGLKLEPRKAPVDVLVIDHAEEPSEN